MNIRATVLLAVPAAAGHAQTANDVNRLNAAIQICNSPMGAGTPECAKLRGQLSGGARGLPGDGTTSAIASLLGGAMAPRAAPAPAAAASVGIDLNKAITKCVARAAGDQVQIQRCLSIAGGGTAPHPR